MTMKLLFLSLQFSLKEGAGWTGWCHFLFPRRRKNTVSCWRVSLLDQLNVAFSYRWHKWCHSNEFIVGLFGWFVGQCFTSSLKRLLCWFNFFFQSKLNVVKCQIHLDETLLQDHNVIQTCAFRDFFTDSDLDSENLKTLLWLGQVHSRLQTRTWNFRDLTWTGTSSVSPTWTWKL